MMNNLLAPEDIANCITALISRNKLWSGKKLYLSFIVNKKAGCFTNKRKSSRYAKLFRQELKSVSSSPVCTKSALFKILFTKYSGHARELALGVLAECIAMEEKDSEVLVITCGGDGTGLEVQEGLFKAAQTGEEKKNAVMNKITLLRLPLGTGNDGTDGHSIEELFDLLKSQVVYTNACAVKVYPEKEVNASTLEASAKADRKNPAKYGDINYTAPWYSFNIASIGLDAYVVFMSNYLKKRIPGEFYHFAVPLSALVFNKDFKQGLAKLEFFDEDDNKICEISDGITLLAFGASGYRVYGGGQKVLPDNNNVCFTPKMPLLKIVKESKGYAEGLHFKAGLSKGLTAKKVRISYDMPILLQCDGEVAMLSRAHFPLIMEKTEPCVRVLSKVL